MIVNHFDNLPISPPLEPKFRLNVREREQASGDVGSAGSEKRNNPF